MKKKLALLLAAVMTMSMLPVMNVFAATDNRLANPIQYVPKKTLFVETSGVTIPANGAKAEYNDVAYTTIGNDLILKLKDDITSGKMFKIQLDNAKWFFRNTATPTAATIAAAGKASTATGTTVTASVAVKDFDGALKDSTTSRVASTYDINKGNYYSTDNGATGTYTRLDNTNTTTGLPVSGLKDQEVPYQLIITPGNSSTAIIKVLKTPTGSPELTGSNTGFLVDSIIKIPMAILSNDSANDIRVSITAGDAAVSTGTYTLATTSGGATVANVDDPKSARDTFPINKVIVSEARIGTLKSQGAFEIVAPNGYSFSDPTAAATLASVSSVPGYTVNSALATVRYKVLTAPAVDTSVLVVTIPSATPSTGLAGAVVVNNLTLNADDDNSPVGDLMLRVRDASSGSYTGLGLTDQKFVGGTKVNWTVNFTAATPTDLISGRYDVNSSENDDQARTADVTFQENATNSWWAGKETVFTLPEGVKFRAVNFDTADNTTFNDGSAAGVGLGDYPVNTSTTSVKSTGVKIDGNTLTLTNMRVSNGDKAKLVMQLWVSVAAGFTGPITLSVDGSAVGTDLTPVTIANVISPVTVTTKVTDVKIGYQYQPVADITITENKAGMLEKGKNLNLSVSDMISNDMSFSPDTKIAVTDGDLKIKTPTIGLTGGSAAANSFTTVNNGSNIIIPIDRTSSKASTITVTNAAVKIDRTIPESNEKPYDLILWGTAIAANYDATPSAPIDTFGTYPGIHTPYIAVVSAANDKPGVLTGEVKVSIGQSTYSVNGKASEMPVAPYISTKSNSTMVPLRFVANAFGIDDSAVLWDNTLRTVTIIHPTRTVQFKIGNSVMTINNNPVTMTSPDGKAVSAEITNERTFVPFRAIGDAFGITVAWDAATQTAIYNPGGQVANTTTTTTTAQ